MRVLITGASRGIGAAIARHFAKRESGACIALLGRSHSTPSHINLNGTLLDVKRDVEKMGATALPIQVDLRDAGQLSCALERTINTFGGLDVLINNASALIPHKITTSKQMDTLHKINTRATALCIQHCTPALKASTKSGGGCIVTMSPPLNVKRADWIAAHPSYTISKYAMSLATIGASEHVRANCIWPRHLVATSATRMLEEMWGVDGAFINGRDPQLFAKAVYALCMDETINGQMMLDDQILPMPSTTAPIDMFV